MAEFSEQYVLGLTPKPEAYDVPESDELAVRVFPNGIKTWVFLFKVGDYTRSRTLGIFPEMSLEQARKEVPTARKIAVLAQDLEKREDYAGATTEIIKQPAEKKVLAKNGNLVAASAAAVLALVALITLIISQHEPLTSSDLEQQSEQSDSEQQTRPASPQPSQTLAQLRINSSPRSPRLDPSPLLINSTRRPIADIPVIAEDPEVLIASTDTVIGTQIMESTDSSGSDSNIVKRAQFASEIRDREPTDKLNSIQTAWENREPRFFNYFSEFYGAEGQTLVHKWYLEDELQSTISFEVGSPFRWRVYSRKRITSDQIGEWRVDIENADGRVLNSDSFVLLRKRRLANTP